MDSSRLKAGCTEKSSHSALKVSQPACTASRTPELRSDITGSPPATPKLRMRSTIAKARPPLDSTRRRLLVISWLMSSKRAVSSSDILSR